MPEQNSQNSSCNTDFNLSEIEQIKANNPDADEAAYSEIEGKIRAEELYKLRDDRTLRKEYANKVFYFIVCWSIGLFVILLLNGFQKFDYYIFGSLFKLNFYFQLGDSVMITLLATSFIEVLGLFYFVMDYLFGKEKEENTKRLKNIKIF